MKITRWETDHPTQIIMETIKDLYGKISLKLSDSQTLEELCLRHVASYDVKRFEIVAVRVFAAKEFIVTIFAADKLNHSTTHPGKLMVKKFKIEGLGPGDFFTTIEAFNFTAINRNYSEEEIEVINK